MGEQGQGRRANVKLASTNLLPTSFGSSSAHPWPYMASPSADSVQLSFGLLYVPPHRIISFLVHWATACTRGTSGLKRPLCPCIIIIFALGILLACACTLFIGGLQKSPCLGILLPCACTLFFGHGGLKKSPCPMRGGTDSAPLTSAHVAGV